MKCKIVGAVSIQQRKIISTCMVWPDKALWAPCAAITSHVYTLHVQLMKLLTEFQNPSTRDLRNEAGKKLIFLQSISISQQASHGI